MNGLNAMKLRSLYQRIILLVLVIASFKALGEQYNEVTHQDPFHSGNLYTYDSKSPSVFVFRDPTYVVIAPKLVRAGQTYRLVVNILPPSPPLEVKATLYKDNIHVAMAEQSCHSLEPHILNIMVPFTSSYGNYRLKLEGNEIGWLSGSAFTNETKLQFSPKGATVLIQSDKPFYKQGTTVRLRIVALDTAVKMVEDSVDVFILSPRGVMLKRWLSRQCREGAISLDFPLSEEAESGRWTIRVEATNSFAEKQFIVESFPDPLFEVRIDTPSFLSSSEEYLEGTVYANYSSGAPVSGNVSVMATLRPIRNGVVSFYRTGPVLLRKRAKFTGSFPFRFHLNELSNVLVWSKTLEVNVTAIVGDALLDCTKTGFSTTRIFGSKIDLRFLGESPFIMRPSMPFGFYITASLMDGSHVTEERLIFHRLIISPDVHFHSGKTKKLLTRTIKMAHDQYGLWSDEIDIHDELEGEHKEDDVAFLTMKAELKDAYGEKSFASLVAVTHHSLKGRQVQVTTSTKTPKVGEYIILHIRSSFYMESFRYILLSKGVIIEAGQEKMEASLKTMPLALTSQMAGTSTIIIFVAQRGEDIVSDVLTFHVDALTTRDLEVSIEEEKPKGHLKVSVHGEPNSIVSLTGIAWDTFKLKAGNDLTQKQIVKQMKSNCELLQHQNIKDITFFEPFQQNWAVHDGLRDEVQWMPKGSLGGDAKQAFEISGLKILSDGGVHERPTHCKAFLGLKPCLLGTCYASDSSCDGQWDCIDRIDEQSCGKTRNQLTSDLDSYRLKRQSYLSLHFENPWLWENVILDNNGTASITVPMPEKTATIALTAFSLHPSSGLTLLQQPFVMTTSPGFWLWVESPKTVGLWEQVGIRVTAVNHHAENLRAVIVLAHSPYYKFVSLEEFEIAQSYPHGPGPFPSRPIRRMVSGEHEHSITLLAGESRTLLFPVVPTILGEIKVTVQASLPGSKYAKSTIIIAEPMGAPEEFHTSLLLDLSSRTYLFTFLDVDIPENHDPGSAKVRISLFGDVVGGVNLNKAVFPVQTLNLPNVGCEPTVFSLLLTVLQLSHWKELHQKPDLNEKKIFSELSLLYQSILAYQNNDGGFRYFKSGTMSSVWLTSLTLRSLNEASTVWPKFLYVDPQVTDRAIRYILKQQTSNGAFWEPSGWIGIRQLETTSSFTLSQFNTGGLNLSSTAYALVNLLSLRQLPEPLDTQVHSAMIKGRTWLEDNLDLVARASKPLEVSLIAYVLHAMSSPLAEEAFGILARNARQEVKYVYWGEDLVPLPSYRVESQRPHLQPRLPQRHDSGNVAATAFALRVYAGRGEMLTPAIVRWLNTQRAHEGGWISTLDTLLAWEALREYSRKKNQAKNVELTVTVETLTNSALPKIFYISKDNVLHLQKHNLDGVKGSIRIQGKGNGTAVLQLSTSYYVSNPAHLRQPPERAFSVRTSAVSGGRNASSLSFTTCVRWIYTTASDTSGLAVLEMTIPTGYGMNQEKLQGYVDSKAVPRLRKATFSSRRITFFFEKIGKSETCVEFTVHRWFPVANLTKVLLIKIYEYYAPELYGVELLDMSSITLDICQVCGSYQCPNCPILSYYSSRALSQTHPVPFLQGTMLLILYCTIKENLLLTFYSHLLKPR